MQAIYIFLAILLGLLLPQAERFVFLIRYFLMGMLFLSFLQVRFSRQVLSRDHLKIAVLNLLLPVMVYFLLLPLHPVVATAAFVIGVAPTAAVAPVIAGFLNARVDRVTASVLVTSPVVALVLPFLLPALLTLQAEISVREVLLPVLTVIFGPLLLAFALRRFWRAGAEQLKRLKPVGFYLFLGNVFLASAKAGHFVREDQTTSLLTFAAIAAATALLCLLQFKLGERIGDRSVALANSLSLGRKNTMFAIWVALTFTSPVVALGPMFYILLQNAYNSWQIYMSHES